MASTSSQNPSYYPDKKNPSYYASDSTPTRWDVFLSFRGQDTRFKFTSHLYAALDRHGVQTFKDDPELHSGEVITDALLQAIQESKTYIVVLSENYASSGWCLDELVEIYKCHKAMKRLVIAVFYNIDPSVARYQTGRFSEAFEKHQVRFGMERVNMWRHTLTEVSRFSGYHISENRSEADIINEIVEEILCNINPKTLDVAKHPVGLESRVKDITALLTSDTVIHAEDPIRIGIYGMGGIGKTTLAKALYNQLLLGSFKGSCFLANVREVSGTTNGLVSLQQQLINDVLRSKKKIDVYNVDQGTKLIEARICSTKVLVVIDDLDDHKQFESLVGPFASGSVVIITTRDEEILDTIEVDTRYRFRVNELDDAESLTLFSRHAFGNATPNNSLMVLSKDVLRHAGGLPLAIEIFGSYLYKRSEVGWKVYTEKLQRIPNRSIQQRLITSLDALESDDPMLKKIFIDIACFFIGKKKEMVIKIMETYYSYADHNIDILKKRCLLTIDDRKRLGMHDLLRDMGREIALNHFPEEPGKHSRLWNSKHIYDVLKKQKGTEAIEGIIPSNHFHHTLEGESWGTETFKRMSKLRFLHLGVVNLTGSFEHTFEDLRWFCWDQCPLKCLPSEFYPQKLVTLELPHSNMRTLWEPIIVPHVFDKLKTLNMSYSLDLTTTPDFTKLPCLETLDLQGCISLEDVHLSIGFLVRLVSLNLRGCVNLRSLQDICNLRALQYLNVGSCSSLEALPTELGNIESLIVLKAEKLSVLELPDSVGRFKKLVELYLSSNKNLETIPNSICNLRALEVLNINDCSSLRGLPIELGNIESLKELSAEGLTVSKLPDSIGRLSKLVQLKLSYNKNLEILPNTISNLRALEVLVIDNCSNLSALPIELGNIKPLKELNAHGLNLSELPGSVGLLRKLVTLRLSKNKNLKTLPDTICNLRALEFLYISGCNSLEALPAALGNNTSLKELNAEGLSVSKLPDSIGRLNKLVELILCHNKKLEKLPDTICDLISLEILDISGCEKLEVLPNQLWKLSGLRELDASGVTLLQKLPDIESSQVALSLQKLNLSRNVITALPSGISKLSNLGYLFLRDCRHLLSIAELPPTLKVLKAPGCTSMERLPNLSDLKQLKILDVTDCTSLTEIHGLKELTSIRILDVGGCNSSLVTYVSENISFRFNSYSLGRFLELPQ